MSDNEPQHHEFPRFYLHKSAGVCNTLFEGLYSRPELDSIFHVAQMHYTKDPDPKLEITLEGLVTSVYLRIPTIPCEVFH